MRSRTASAWVRSMRPLRKARMVNSPGSARRAPPPAPSQPHDAAPPASRDTKSRPRRRWYRNVAWRKRSRRFRRCARRLRDRSVHRNARVRLPTRDPWASRSIGRAICSASAPDSRTTPMPPRPGGVAIATMVSSRCMVQDYSPRRHGRAQKQFDAADRQERSVVAIRAMRIYNARRND